MSEWKIENLSDADWALRQIKAADEELQEKLDYAKEQEAKLKAYKANEKERAESRMAFFMERLEAYLRERQEEDPRFKLSTAVGSVNFRKTKKWEYDEETVMKQLKEDTDLSRFVRTKEEINKAQMKKELIVTEDGKTATGDGEIIDGITVTIDESLQVKFN